MTKLIKEEEEFLKLLLEQDWDNDIQAYLKFREKLPENLAIQYDEIIKSLQEKGFIRKKYKRKFILSECAKKYTRIKFIDFAKNFGGIVYKLFGLLSTLVKGFL